MQNMFLRTLTEEEAERLKCHWTKDVVHLSWETGCGHKFQTNQGDPILPVQDRFKYCPFCGSKISLDDNGGK